MLLANIGDFCKRLIVEMPLSRLPSGVGFVALCRAVKYASTAVYWRNAYLPTAMKLDVTSSPVCWLRLLSGGTT
ncbi:uncharacterized protein B0H18DRAFT_972183 [Fomitopsis serialis]|uniref:uncharacterized protein n=1 Tax=Fomitopsis serialis TaxID=139415 RepID=UPI002007E68F|nr:uncharacterized protein B0H18DRAFT_1018097 [Neoantrodia serialis]XP_047898350.1 uncharacterized protein B0H18DRAFT_980514 [Neoantrodia serialis]XP_047899469.1 uncharacterized protein B0H18DRAFT_972183 [Neoantrodia serialis]KAH9922366.1 hypothetical protein B0H18DRAFT_1018097 [Neoantrodia serialis]KAH9934284.1 hypothetical protein B0H18DRAFT_980514 [Neoantrodia serialis]KAH9936105.1 hypothetical protein B0H18DRAFT_972183 [Neoantrodia serialis]